MGSNFSLDIWFLAYDVILERLGHDDVLIYIIHFHGLIGNIKLGLTNIAHIVLGSTMFCRLNRAYTSANSLNNRK